VLPLTVNTQVIIYAIKYVNLKIFIRENIIKILEEGNY
jgi:hypothetical protein